MKTTDKNKAWNTYLKARQKQEKMRKRVEKLQKSFIK